MNRRSFLAALTAVFMPWRKAEAAPKSRVYIRSSEPMTFTLEPGVYRIKTPGCVEQVTLANRRTFAFGEAPIGITRIA